MAISYTSILGLKTRDPLKVSERVAAGLSYRTLERFRQSVALPMGRVAELVSIPARTLVRRKEQGRLLPEESDRLVRMSRVVALAIGLFEGDRAAAQQWLKTPLPTFRGRAPLELASTDVGAREVEHLVGRLEHGIIS